MSNELLSVENDKDEVIIPSGKSLTGNSVKVDVTDVYKALDRISELQRANESSVAELMMTFNSAMVTTSHVIGIIQLELNYANATYEEERSICMLDRVEKVLIEKGHKSTADMRDAALNVDPVVKKWRERSDMLEVLNTFFNHKYNELREALYSTKKISDNSKSMPNHGNKF